MFSGFEIRIIKCPDKISDQNQCADIWNFWSGIDNKIMLLPIPIVYTHAQQCYCKENIFNALTKCQNKFKIAQTTAKNGQKLSDIQL